MLLFNQRILSPNLCSYRVSCCCQVLVCSAILQKGKSELVEQCSQAVIGPEEVIFSLALISYRLSLLWLKIQ
jgi:hypothetical protein